MSGATESLGDSARTGTLAAMTGKVVSWRAAGNAFAVLFIVFMLCPLVIVLITSFTAEAFVRFPPTSYGLRWYIETFQNSSLMGGLLFSIEIATAVAVISGILGVAATLAIARGRFPGRDALVMVLTLPLATPHVVIGLALLQMFAFLQVATSPWGLIGGHIIITVPFVVRLTLTSLHDMDPLIERASYSLGASPWQTFRYVTLPLIMPGVIAGVVFAFLISFDEATIAIFLATPSQTTLPAQIFVIAFQGSDPIIAASSGVLILIAVALVLLVERFFGVLRLLVGTKSS